MLQCVRGQGDPPAVVCAVKMDDKSELGSVQFGTVLLTGDVMKAVVPITKGIAAGRDGADKLHTAEADVWTLALEEPDQTKPCDEIKGGIHAMAAENDLAGSIVAVVVAADGPSRAMSLVDEGLFLQGCMETESKAEEVPREGVVMIMTGLSAVATSMIWQMGHRGIRPCVPQRARGPRDWWRICTPRRRGYREQRFLTKPATRLDIMPLQHARSVDPSQDHREICNHGQRSRPTAQRDPLHVLRILPRSTRSPFSKGQLRKPVPP